MIIVKNKQEQAEKNVKEIIVGPILAVEAVQEIVESAGKFDQSAREDLKKEMKMIKESRDGKEHRHKKKKHHHHKHHKDRSHSPQAKFSSDSQKELPKYIQNQYNKDQQKVVQKVDVNNTRLSDSPLRYDPEEEELLKKEVIHPKGSVLKIKSCNAEVQTRRLGKVEFPIDIMTEEEHRRILEVVDPGFIKLTIHKYKNEAEMLPYINKSRKKYRFVVGWLQASNPTQNELLRDLAEQATDKKKVFGWQNDHIKIHMMSVKQLMTLPKFNSPARVTTKQASEILLKDRMVIVIQFPQRLYQIRDQYKPFENILCKTQEYPVDLPAPTVEARSINDYYHNYTVPTIEPLIKPVVKEREVDYQGWGEPVVPAQNISLNVQPQLNLPVQPQSQYGLPPKINQVRMQLNFGAFSPINTESEDNDDDKDERGEDLAANLLSAFDVPKVAPTPPVAPTEHEKIQQQYQGYYSGYQAYPPQQQQRPMPADSRWMNYPQQAPQPQNVYNPLNPVTGKYQPSGAPGSTPVTQPMPPAYPNPTPSTRPPAQSNSQYYETVTKATHPNDPQNNPINKTPPRVKFFPSEYIKLLSSNNSYLSLSFPKSYPILF